MITIEKEQFMKIMNEHAEMKVRLESIENALDVFTARCPNWILSAKKDDYRVMVTALMAIMGKVGK